MCFAWRQVTSIIKSRASTARAHENSLTFVNTWQLITCSTGIYAINKIKPVLQSIIDSSQTGFMKGRYIGEKIRLIFELLDTTDQNNIPGLLFFSDFEIAFDSV